MCWTAAVNSMTLNPHSYRMYAYEKKNHMSLARMYASEHVRGRERSGDCIIDLRRCAAILCVYITTIDARVHALSIALRLRAAVSR